MDLYDTVKTSVVSSGADYIGVADLVPAREFIVSFGGEQIAKYPRAVSIGIRLLDSLVDLLPDRQEYGNALLYRHGAYDAVNVELDRLALSVSKIIQNQGYNAIPIPAAKRASDEKIAAVFSHKLAAHLAGLGWIGKSCLLVTPNNGPRVRWVSILTDAPLAPTGSPMEQRCGDCTQCASACPAGAITGRAFDKEETREARMGAAECQAYYFGMEKTLGVAVCGMFLYVCPYGRKNAGVFSRNSP